MSRKLRKKILGDSLIWVIIAAICSDYAVSICLYIIYCIKIRYRSCDKCRKDLTESGTVGEFYKSMAAAGFPKCFFNSFIVAIAVTVTYYFFFVVLAAYVFTRLEFKGRNIVFILYLSTMMIPITVRLIPFL